MARLTPLTLCAALLAACSSDPSTDAEDDSGGSTTEEDPGGTGEDGSSSSEGSESGEPVEEWPPACLESTPTSGATCATLEVTLPAERCDPASGLWISSVESLWYRKDPDEPKTVIDTIVGGCSVERRTVIDEGGPHYLRLALTYEADGASWLCVLDDWSSEAMTTTIVQLGDEGRRDVDSTDLYGPTDGIPVPPSWEYPEYRYGCCLLSGTPTDAYVQTPC